MTPHTREQRLVQVLLRAVETALLARRAEDPGTLRDEADSAMQLAFEPVWGCMSQLALDVAPRALRFDRTDVLAREDDPSGLIAALDGAGIRKLTLLPGCELEEIKVVLSAVAASGDLLTALFRADLHHVEYSLVETPSGEGPAVAPSQPPAATPGALREAVRADAEAPPASQGIVRLEKFDSTLYFLDDNEIEYLKSAVDRVYADDLSISAVSLLLDILELQREPEVREEVIGILEDLLTHLLANGKFEAVAHLVGGVREAAREADGLVEKRKSRLDRLRASVSQPGPLRQLFHALEGGGVRPTPESMGALLREMRPEAIRQVLAWSDRLSDRETRAAVVAALDAFFTEWPHALSRMLQTPDRDVVEAGLDLAARLKADQFVDIVGEISSHEDPLVRRAVVRTLAAIGTAAALRRLTLMADDADRDVRVDVYRSLIMRPFRPAFGTLQRAILAPDLEKHGQREKRALFEAFGEIAGAEGVSLLEPLLRGRNSSGPRPSAHTRACAATALGLIGTPDARDALSRAADDKDPLVRNAAHAALRGEAP